LVRTKSFVVNSHSNPALVLSPRISAFRCKGTSLNTPVKSAVVHANFALSAVFSHLIFPTAGLLHPAPVSPASAGGTAAPRGP